MREKIKTILSRTAAKTFEELVFLFAFDEYEADTGQTAPAVAARISFSGFFSGALVLKLSAKILPELTTNMLGVDEQEETTLDQQYDALKETLNVICGNLLPEIAGTQEVFDIDPPEIVAEEEAAKKRNGANPTCNVTLALEQGLCELFLFMDDRIPLNDGITQQE
jgi:chemotaxis protein CheY-P-specific phosphatase CheC